MNSSLSTPTQIGRRAPWYRYSRFWFRAAVYALLLSTALAVVTTFTETPRDPYATMGVVEWWLRAIDPGRVKEMDTISADLRGVTVSRDGKTLWVAGNAGLIAKSTDGGQRWVKEAVQRARHGDCTPNVYIGPKGRPDTLWTIRFPCESPSPATAVVDATISTNGRQYPGPMGRFALDDGSILFRLNVSGAKIVPPPGTGDLTFEVDGKPRTWRVNVVASRVPTAASNDTTGDDIIWVGDAGDYFGAFTTSGYMHLLPPGGSWREGPLYGPEGAPYRSARIYFNAEHELMEKTLVGIDDMLITQSGDAGDQSTVATPLPPKVNTVIDGRYGRWAVGNRGALLRHVSDSWTRMPADGATDLRSIEFHGAGHGCIVGTQGYLATTADGGQTWTKRATHTRVPLNAITYLPGEAKTMYVAGNRGTVLRSDDLGGTWRHVTAEWQGDGISRAGIPLPPPWYVLFNALVTLPLLGIAARSLGNDEKITETDSVAESIGSDRPLVKGDPDAMNLRATALTISRFLRNENTKPPLTIGVTGEWGSGKSSLMNLLRADLEDFGFRPVWFNAWHHEKEEHLLASLLHAIREQAVPPIWRPENFFFRLNLIRIRGWKNLAALLFVVVILATAIGLETNHQQGQSPFAPIAKLVESIFEAKDLPSMATLLPEGLRHIGVYLITVAAILRTVWSGVKAFRGNPAALLAKVSRSASISDLQAEISFRDRFASEFNDVTKALGARSMLIFIDDLDRCSPESTGEILEAVNFLVSSGECFVVLGMDINRVERYVGVNFKHISDAEPEFARNYLHKLINIEVPLPALSQEASSRILVPQRATAKEQPSRWAVARGLAVDAMKFWPLALLIVVAGVGFFTGRQWSTVHEASVLDTPNQPPTDTAATPPTTAETATAAVTSTAAPAPASSTAEPAIPLPVRTNQSAYVVSGTAQGRYWIYWPAVLFLIPLAGVWWWLMTRPPDLIVRDSPQFVEAIGLWLPVIVAKHHTPRALKRFMNRIRFLAMGQRPPSEEATMWRQLRLALIGGTRETPQPPANAIPEAALVALAAIEAIDVSERDRFAFPVEQHKTTFGHDLATYETAYQRLIRGVQVN